MSLISQRWTVCIHGGSLHLPHVHELESSEPFCSASPSHNSSLAVRQVNADLVPSFYGHCIGLLYSLLSTEVFTIPLSFHFGSVFLLADCLFVEAALDMDKSHYATSELPVWFRRGACRSWPASGPLYSMCRPRGTLQSTLGSAESGFRLAVLVIGEG